MSRKRNWGRLDTRNRPPHHKGIPDASWDMWTNHIFCVDLYSWVGEEEGYDGCVAFPSRQMQRGVALLQRQRNRRRGEGCMEIQQEGGREEGQGGN